MMKITIIDKDRDFSNILSKKLKHYGYQVEHFISINILKIQGDICLLSTDFSEEECSIFIERFNSKIIILMASTYSDSTIRYPLDLGAKDYVIKPFRIEELNQKIDYFRLKLSIDSYQSYIGYALKDIDTKKAHLHKLNPPVILHTNHTVFIDKLVMEYCQNEKEIFTFISLSSKNWKTKIKNAGFSHLIYISNLQLLKEYDVVELFRLLKDRKFIISTTKHVKTHYRVIKLNTDMQFYDGSYIMSIEEYIQFIIKNFQYKITDTELAKQLDFSRKTLYERRNKYSIYKIKNHRMIS